MQSEGGSARGSLVAVASGLGNWVGPNQAVSEPRHLKYALDGLGPGYEPEIKPVAFAAPMLLQHEVEPRAVQERHTAQVQHDGSALREIMSTQRRAILPYLHAELLS